MNKEKKNENERKNSLKQTTTTKNKFGTFTSTERKQVEKLRKVLFWREKYGFIRQPYLQHFFGFYLNVLFAVKKLFSV